MSFSSRPSASFLFWCGTFLLSLGLFSRHSLFATIVYPPTTFPQGVSIAQISVTGMTPDDAKAALATHTPPSVITITYQDAVLATASATLGFHHNGSAVVDMAWQDVQREYSTILSRYQHRRNPNKKDYALTWRYEQESVATWLSPIIEKFTISGQEPALQLGVSNVPTSIKLTPGKTSRTLTIPTTIQNLSQQFTSDTASASAVFETTTQALDASQSARVLSRAKQFVGKKIIFEREGLDLVISDTTLLSFLTLPEGFSTEKLTAHIATIQKTYSREPQDAVLDYDQKTLKVSRFVPQRDGIQVDDTQVKTTLQQVLTSIDSGTETKIFTFPLPTTYKKPNKTLGETNTLGIKERIGFGESEYDHSIPGRVHNVSLTTQKITNTLVPAGAEFSFNKTLGEVSAKTGFAPAYVIRGGRTELGDGGGVCQVSTTTFRAVLSAGLPVTKRLPHSYRVSYYEINAKPGIDATVYAGETDFRFKNDTGHAILIHAEAFPTDYYMFVEIYGTSDGRTTEITNHQTWDAVAAPAPMYQDDPSLPRGRVKQVDFAAAGIKARFTNVVRDKSGQILREDTYTSIYKPWRAVFLRGTG